MLVLKVTRFTILERYSAVRTVKDETENMLWHSKLKMIAFCEIRQSAWYGNGVHLKIMPVQITIS